MSAFLDRSRRIGWIVGLPGLGLILGLAIPLLAPRVEAPLGRAADTIARETAGPGAEPWLRAIAAGRDLVVTGEAPDGLTRDTAYARLAAIPGLRRIVGPVGLVEPASPFVWTATRTPDGAEFTGFRPAEIGAGALAESLAPVLAAEARLNDRARAALGAPPDFVPAAAYAVARLRALRPGARVTLEDTRLSVSGEAASVEDYEALRAALATLPNGYALGRAEIVPAAIPDFRFTLTRQAGGDLALSGNVVSEAARAAILTEAALTSEGAPVTDRMRTARGLAPGIDPAAMARFSLQLAALLQEGSVMVADGAVSLSGVALDGQAVPEVEALLRDGRPAGLSRGAVALGTRPLSPYRVTLRREADTVILGGHLPDQAARDALLAALRPRFFRERIVDRIRMAQGAPSDLSRALDVAIGPFSTLATGEIRVADRSLRLTGTSLYPESARRIEGTLPAALPAGWSAEVTVGASGARTSELDTCAARFQGLVQERSLRFAPGSAALRADFYASLDGLAALAKACPSLRIEVTGHGDPAGAAPAKPVLEGSVESTASVEPAKAPGPEAGKTAPPAKPPEPKKAEAKPRTDKATSAGAKAKAEAAPKPAPAPPEPEPDLPRQRALVLVEYLLQAGVEPGQVSAAPPGKTQAPNLGAGFTLRP